MTNRITFERGVVRLTLSPEEYWFVCNSVLYPLGWRVVSEFREMFSVRESVAMQFHQDLLAAESEAKASGSHWLVPRVPKFGVAGETKVVGPDINGGQAEGDLAGSGFRVRYSSDGAVLSLSPDLYRLVRATTAYALSEIADSDFYLILMTTRYYAQRLVSAIEAAEADATRKGIVVE